MTIHIEIVGEGQLAQRMIAQIRESTPFEIVVSPSQEGAARRMPPEQCAATLRFEGRPDSFAILHENGTTGEVEGLPVVTLRARKEERQGVIWE